MAIERYNVINMNIPYEKRPKLNLAGIDGNAYAIMGAVSKALKKAGLTQEAKQYMQEAMSGDYDNLLRVSMDCVRD